MAYTQEQIEWLHDNGKMPDWAYFQQNGKTAQQNYVEATRRAKEKILKRYEEQQAEARRKAEEREMEKKLDAERQRSHELTCELKFHRQLIHLLYPDLDRKLGECSGGENQNES